MKLFNIPTLVPVLIIVLALILRLAGIGSFMTVDEENWMIRSGEFWRNLFLNDDPGGTFRTSHPGVMTMWIGGAGIFLQELRLGFHVDTSNLEYFRRAATMPIAVATSILIGGVAWLTIRLKGTVTGVLVGLLLATDPYLVGMSQIIHLDALLALLMLTAFLSFLLYWRTNLLRYLILAGIFTGLAMLNKFLPALWLFVMYGLYMLINIKRPVSERIMLAIRRGMFVAGIVGIMFFLLWPALLVMKNTVDYLRRDTITIVTDEHVAIETSEEPIAPASFYPRTLLARSTLLVLAVWLGMVILNTRYIWKEKRVPDSAWIIAYTIGFTILITFVAKKGDRYVLPALVGMMFTAGEGLAIAWVVLRDRVQQFRHRFAPLAALIVLAALLAAQVLVWTPYAIAYNNPVFDVRSLTQQGWGEGLDAAARWLNQHPFADKLYVASWYPGVMQTYFVGRTMSLSSREDHRIGFVVLYRNMESRAEDDIASNVIDEYKSKEPEHVIHINDEPYVWIYNTLGPRYFRQHVGELMGDMEVGQLVPIAKNNWDRIDFGIATFSGRNNTEDVIVHIREDINSTTDLRTIRVNATEIEDEAWQAFDFEPIPDSAGKTYYVAVTSPTSHQGNAITLRYVKEDVMPGQMIFRREALKESEQTSDFIREGDVAYRLP